MAKVKKNKVKQRPFFSYTDEDMQKAIKAVRENGLSKKLAAQQFGVPRSTLIRKLSGQAPLLRKMGPPTELSKTEEEVLVKWILVMAKKGFPIHKNNLILSVKKIVEESRRETKYLNNSSLPGRSWFQGILKRHPEIRQRHAESVSKARAAVTKDRICNWFDEILKYLKENKMEEILLDPTRIFNGDEAGFQRTFTIVVTTIPVAVPCSIFSKIFPTPLKKILVLPRTPEKKTSKGRRVIYPAVISSGKYRECYEYEAKKKKEKKKIVKESKEDESKAEEQGKKGGKKMFSKEKDCTRKSNILESSCSDSSDSIVDIKYDDEDLDLSDNEELDLQVGEYVIIRYKDSYCPGLILKKDYEGAEIQSMVNAGFGSWKWPSKEDVLYYFKNDIVCIIAEPHVKNNRGHYTVPEMAKYE